MCGLAMTTSSEGVAELEAKAIRTTHRSRHKSRRRKRIAARIAIILGLAVGLVAIFDFAYNAYERASGLATISTGADGRRLAGNANESPTHQDAYLSHFEELQQLDAAAVVLAAACVITSTVISRRMKRH